MITFFDGPAAGQVLACRRAPVFLRVVKSRTKWDALDQPGDTPNPGEHLYAYLLPGKPEWMHLRMSPRSLVATLAFMGAGFVTVFLIRHALA